MADITTLILDDHETFRRWFAQLDELDDPDELSRVWEALAELLDLHAAAEEAVFYPELVQRGTSAEDETLDAVGDHNEIRDAVHDAARHPVGSTSWYRAVRAARVANSDHMAEEEYDALADFRGHADAGLREELGRRFQEFKDEHPGASGVDTSDIDPQRYLRRVEDVPEEASDDGSLGIGSLKGVSQ